MAETSAADSAPKLHFPPKWRVFVIVAVLSLVADQATKIWARSVLPTDSVHGAGVACVITFSTSAR